MSEGPVQIGRYIPCIDAAGTSHEGANVSKTFPKNLPASSDIPPILLVAWR